jgi:TRAP-type C4-dicarboxylate transport system permease small subunit
MQDPTILRGFNALVRLFDKALAVLLGVLVGGLAVGVIASVILRYLFNVSFAWAEESLTMVFIATTFFGAALGLREGEHIAISLPSGKGAVALRAFLRILSMAVIVVVSWFVFKYSRLWISKVGTIPSPATGIENGVFYAIVPISFGITIFYAVLHIVSEFVGIEPPVTKSRFDGDVETGDAGGTEP